jgi:hypothetical protein
MGDQVHCESPSAAIFEVNASLQAELDVRANGFKTFIVSGGRDSDAPA